MLTRTWDPWSDLARLQDDLGRWFDVRARTPGGAEGLEKGTWAPPVDIYEDAERITLVADLPGVEQKSIDIRLENGLLSLRGERKATRPEAGPGHRDGYQRVERVQGSFARSFTVPNLIDAEKILAAMKDGVLTLTLPKRAEAQPRQIKVRVD
jgi:HSP20 family protein